MNDTQTQKRRWRSLGRRRVVIVATAVVSLAGGTMVAAGAGSGSGQQATTTTAPAATDRSDEFPITECGTVDGTGCVPTSERVDLVRPTFSKPLEITNPLFPVSKLQSVVQVGTVDGKPFRSETTRLPQTGVVDWYGTKVPVVISQYTAYLDGKITEVAIDRYAQADDGSVWYFGEDVIDYEKGGAFFTEGTWLAGRDGPPAMIMPANPKLGDVFRVENILGIVFEELKVTKVSETVAGPSGPVPGAIVLDELGTHGQHSSKTLAPGYGEFVTTGGGDIEAMAVASPTDAISGGAPAEIRHTLTAAWGTFEFARADDWDAVDLSIKRIAKQVTALDGMQQPARVMTLLHGSLNALRRAAKAKNPRAAERACTEIAQAAIDLEARYLAPLQVEVARFHLHTQALRTAALARRRGDVRAEVATLEWIRDRMPLEAAAGATVDHELTTLRTAAEAGSLVGSADIAARLGSLVRDATAA